MNENFDYEGVKAVMDNRINGATDRAVQIFNEGASEIDEAMGATTGEALSGAAGATAKNTWTTLTEHFQNFGDYVMSLIEEARELQLLMSNAEKEMQDSLNQVNEAAGGE